MYAGEVVESGVAAPVLDEPAHPYTMALLGANPHVPEGEPVPIRLASIVGTVPAARKVAHRLPFRQPLPVRRGQVHARRSRPSPAHGSGSVLCVRVDELHRTNLTWEAEEIGAETAPTAGVL